MVGAFEQVIKQLEEQDCKPIVNVKNNECSKGVEQNINNNDIDNNLCSAKNHHLNGPGERAIRSYKDHLLAHSQPLTQSALIQL